MLCTDKVASRLGNSFGFHRMSQIVFAAGDQILSVRHNEMFAGNEIAVSLGGFRDETTLVG